MDQVSFGTAEKQNANFMRNPSGTKKSHFSGTSSFIVKTPTVENGDKLPLVLVAVAIGGAALLLYLASR